MTAIGHNRRLDLLIGNTLRIGVMLAAILCVIGGALFLARQGGEIPEVGGFRPEPSPLREISGFLPQAMAGDARAIVMLGILVLLATPVVRVALSVLVFLHERDSFYVAVTLVVLAILVWSIFFAP